MTLLSGGAVVSAGRVLVPGWVEVAGARIVAVGEGMPPGPVERDDVGVVVDLAGRTLVPGFVDMHVHGGGGGSFPSGEPAQAVVAAATHRRHGTTTMLASLVSAAVGDLAGTCAALGDLVQDGVVAGIHLEGPWLSPDHRGAHGPDLLRLPDAAAIEQLLAAAQGRIAMVTMAPELPGGIPAVRRLSEAGVVVAVGHTDATYAQTRDAVAVGARVGTHLFNAMRALHHREPGPVVALLEDERATVELVADGVHLHPAVIRHVLRTAGAERVALVTDAMAAAGAGDGDYRLGDLAVEVRGGVARLALEPGQPGQTGQTGQGAIAGSTLTMDAAFGFVVAHCGASLPEAAQMTSGTPSRVLGLTDRGSIAAGLRADLVVLDANLQVERVMVAGEWVPLG